MADSVMKKWYVVRAIGGQENKVKSYIETEIEVYGFLIMSIKFCSY